MTAILTGTVAHGGTIPLPDGYTQAQCKWTVSINNVAQTIPYGVVTDLQCYASSSRVVTARMYVYSVGWYNATANYMIIGVK